MRQEAYEAERKDRLLVEVQLDGAKKELQHSNELLNSFYRKEGECKRHDCVSQRKEIKQLRKDVEVLTKWSPLSDRRLTI